MKLTLAVGTKNWSSWSLRGWLPVKLSGLSFEEQCVQLRHDDTEVEVKKISPSGLVPLLTVEDEPARFQVWDSLAIAEFMAELAPDARLWPKDRTQRAKARAVAAEMHSGFAALRQQYPMDFARHRPGIAPEPATQKAIDRIVRVWEDCLSDSNGPFLFGDDFGNADAFYAPVVSRFRTYDVALSPDAQAYAGRVWAHPLMQDWLRAAEDEVKRGVV